LWKYFGAVPSADSISSIPRSSWVSMADITCLEAARNCQGKVKMNQGSHNRNRPHFDILWSSVWFCVRDFIFSITINYILVAAIFLGCSLESNKNGWVTLIRKQFSFWIRKNTTNLARPIAIRILAETNAPQLSFWDRDQDCKKSPCH
jgi:hypothetical protein